MEDKKPLTIERITATSHIIGIQQALGSLPDQMEDWKMGHISEIERKLQRLRQYYEKQSQ